MKNSAYKPCNYSWFIPVATHYWCHPSDFLCYTS